MKKKKKGKSALEASFDYLSARPRTIREMEDHLDQLNYGEVEVYEAVERLKELGYLDDGRYARDFIASRLSTKPVSRRKLREQLLGHHIDSGIVDEAVGELGEESDYAAALEVAEKFYRQFEGREEKERCQRTMKRLVGRGYPYGVIKAAMEKVCGECPECEIEECETAAWED